MLLVILCIYLYPLTSKHFLFFCLCWIHWCFFLQFSETVLQFFLTFLFVKNVFVYLIAFMQYLFLIPNSMLFLTFFFYHCWGFVCWWELRSFVDNCFLLAYNAFCVVFLSFLFLILWCFFLVFCDHCHRFFSLIRFLLASIVRNHLISKTCFFLFIAELFLF